MNDLPRMLFDAVSQHLPGYAAWAQSAALAAGALAAVVLVLRGARTAPLFTAIVLTAGGAAAGFLGGQYFNIPAAPTAGLGAAIGLAVGLAYFRFWLAVLVAVCFACVSSGVYADRVLLEPLASYTSHNLDVADPEQLGVRLPAAADALAAASTEATPTGRLVQELGHIWAFLGQSVPNFQISLSAVAVLMAVAGFLFGILLPRASRAVWAATSGTFLLMLCGVGLAQSHAPALMEWLLSIGRWGWAIVGGVWAISLIINLRDMQKAAKKAAAPAPAE